MYSKKLKGFLSHIDFIILDIFALFIAYVLSFYMRMGDYKFFDKEFYSTIVWLILVIDFVVLCFGNNFENILKRGHYAEFVSTVKNSFMIFGIFLFSLYVMKISSNFSRPILGFTMLLYIVISYIARLLWKNIVIKNQIFLNRRESVLIISTEEKATEMIELLKGANDYFINGIAIIDKDMKGCKIDGIEVVSNKQDIIQHLCKEWIDSVFLYNSIYPHIPTELLKEIADMGAAIHIVLLGSKDLEEKKHVVEEINDHSCLTFSMNCMTYSQVVFKRMIDIAGGIVGCLMTLLIVVIVGPLIYISSPGPIFFAQTRVGRNGKKFKMYKFRSMYMDAEERKKELMKKNRVKDGLMFKLDFDTRIIGNKILPNGEQKTGIGDFIRRTSLDEFPQFFNVLKGDMSLIGTRPPTIDEWEKYKPYHHARLAIKPGITGMWQVSGRSNITDFDDVVSLDLKYINNWSIGLDIKILVKTFVVVFKKDGSM